MEVRSAFEVEPESVWDFGSLLLFLRSVWLFQPALGDLKLDKLIL